MYLGLIILAVTAAAVCFGGLYGVIRSFKLNAVACMILILAAMGTRLFPEISVGDSVIGWGGIFLIVSALVYYAFFPRRAVNALSIAAVTMLLLVYRRLTADMDYFSPIAYVIIAGIASFLLTREYRSVFVVNVLSFFAAETIAYAVGFSETVNVGAGFEYDYYVLATAISVVLVYFYKLFTDRVRTKRAQSFEAARIDDGRERDEM